MTLAALNERGVTLVELLVAMLLLAIALVGLAASFPLAMFGVTSGGFQTTATLLAQKCLDMAKGVAWDVLDTKLQNPDDATQTHCVDGAVAGYPGFNRTTTVAIGPTTTLKVVTVRITFIDQAGGTANDTTIATMLAQ